MYKTLHKKQGSVTVQLRFARSSVTFCAKRDSRFPLDYDELVREARQAQAVLEVNNSSLNPQSARQGGRENITELLKTCMKYDQPVIMGTDSHMCFAIGAFDDAEQLMRELEFPKELVLNYDPENIRKLINITL